MRMNDLSPIPGSVHKKKRVGRGNSSGQRVTPMPVVLALIGVPDAKQRCFVQRRTEQLKPDRQALRREAAGYRQRGLAEDVRRKRVMHER